MNKILSLYRAFTRYCTDVAAAVSVWFGLLALAMVALPIIIAINIGITATEDSNLQNRVSFANRIAAKCYQEWYLLSEIHKVTGDVTRTVQCGNQVLTADMTEEQVLDSLKRDMEQRLEGAFLVPGTSLIPSAYAKQDQMNYDRDKSLAGARIVAIGRHDDGGPLITFRSVAKMPVTSQGTACDFSTTDSTDGCLVATSEYTIGFYGSGTTTFVPFAPSPEDVKPSVNVVVKDLSLSSEQNITHAQLSAFAEDMETVVSAIKMVTPELYSGLVQGSMPSGVVGGTSGALVPDPDFGGVLQGSQLEADAGGAWSGCMYDVPISASGNSGLGGGGISAPRFRDESRKWPMYMEFYAQHVRRCNQDPVWTYEQGTAGKCDAIVDKSCEWDHTKKSDDIKCPDYSESNMPAGALKWGAYTEICENTLKTTDDWCGGKCTWRGDGHNNCQCGEYIDKVWKADPNPGACAKRHKKTWTEKVTKDIAQGRWYASCPKTATGAGDVYLPPSQFMRFSAVRVSDLSGSVDYPPGDPRRITLTQYKIIKGAGSNDHQKDELNELHLKNTDRAWPWACENAGALPATYRATGEFGRPWGAYHELGDRDARALVTDTGTNNTLPEENCTLPEPPSKSVDKYKVLIGPEDCDLSSADYAGCNIPAGRYHILVRIEGLRGPTQPAADPIPPTTGGPKDPPKFSPVGGGRWVYPGSESNCDHVPDEKWDTNADGTGDTLECGGDAYVDDEEWCPFENAIAKTGNHGGLEYSEARHWLVGREAAKIIPIPGERIFMASANSEYSRNSEGAPINQSLDTFDEYLLWGKQLSKMPINDNTPISIALGPGNEEACDEYKSPWFCGPDKPEHNELPYMFEIGERRGVAVFDATHNGQEFVFGATKTGSAADQTLTYFRGGDPYPHKNSPAQPISCVKEAGGTTPAANIAVARNNIKQVMDEVKKGYGPWGIFRGHGANQCALFKAGAHKAKQGPADAKRVLWYIGSCPTEFWSDTNHKFDDGAPGIGGAKVNWFAMSNAPTTGAKAGRPGAHYPQSHPKNLFLQEMNTKARSNVPGLREATLQCFRTVAAQMDAVRIITDGTTCQKFIDAFQIGDEIGSSVPTSACDISESRGDCIALMLYDLLTVPREVNIGKKL